MNELLQKHGCANVFNVPEGLKELMADISREVLRDQPTKIFDFIANYLSVLLITREHGILATRILEDLCDCKPTVSEHLMQLGIDEDQAHTLSVVIKEEIEGFEPEEGKETIKETSIMKKILTKSVLDEDMAARVCQVARNAYREYWYRKKLLEESMKEQPDEPWEIAAQHTLELYKKTKPSFSELSRAAERIQAAYRGYHIRRSVLNRLKTSAKKPKVDLLGPPLDVAESREIDLGPILDITVKADDVNAMFAERTSKKLGLKYDPMKTITHVEDQEILAEQTEDVVGSLHRLPETLVSKLVAGEKSQPEIEAATSTLHRQSMASKPESGRPSRAMSMSRISFAGAPPEVIPELQDVEDLGEQDYDMEVYEEMGMETAEVVDAETVDEVPEDITDDRTEGDGESAPTSVPSSAPQTADNTDVDEAGVTSGTEEGD